MLARSRLPGGGAARRRRANSKARCLEGPPTALHLPAWAGRCRWQVDNGQFAQLEPGVGRLLGVLSLQALPRRITLDFQDVFSEGFAFDRFPVASR